MECYYYIPAKLKGISPVIWEYKVGDGNPQKWKMLPEFNIDLIFNLSKPWAVHNDIYAKRSFNPTANFCFLSGLHTKPLYTEFSHGHMLGIRLNTIAAHLLFGMPCKELKNWSLEGDSILKHKLSYIQDHIGSLPDFQSRALWLEDFVYSLTSHDADFGMVNKITSLLDKICTVKQDDKTIRIEDMTGYSRMHTTRLFHKWFGLAPSEALAYKRYENALNQIHYSSASMTDIGLNNGFYDQPHFIRVFKQFAEMTPRQYLLQKTELIGQLPYDQ